MSFDLEGGIKNALERGASLEEAIRSFVNAGYTEQDVMAVAQKVNPTLLPMSEPEVKPAPTEQTKPKKLPSQDIVLKKDKKKGSGIILLLVLVLVILLVSFTASILFKDQLIEIIKNLLGK